MSNDQTSAWKSLTAHSATLQNTHLRAMLPEPGRFDRFSLKLPGLLIDYTRQRIDATAMALLQDLATTCDIVGWRERMFDGDAINTSENRAVLHTALRRPRGDKVLVNDNDIMPGIHATLDQMEKFCAAVHDGSRTGHTGKRITNIINIGIGGSDLGPRMVLRALKDYRVKDIDTHFVSNVDGADLYGALSHADPETTLFLIASKTFTTLETMANAKTARDWAVKYFKDPACIASHFVALSTNAAAVAEFGIAPENMFGFGDWVGGRYSLWSAIGLSIALACGFDNFRKMLDGGHAMDQHFRTAPLTHNAPVLLALLGVWNRNFFDNRGMAILAYAQNMSLFTAWLQQADMESNGKSVSRDGERLNYKTGPLVFGTAGTDCQHSYFQLVHQGTDIIPSDFIASLKPDHPYPDHHMMLLANMVAQADALADGRSLADSGDDPQRSFDGNRPSTVLLLDCLNPYNLGQLMALYEHKIFVQGIIWNINSFDQWGVELGKVLAKQVMGELSGTKQASGLITYIRDHS